MLTPLPPGTSDLVHRGPVNMTPVPIPNAKAGDGRIVPLSMPITPERVAELRRSMAGSKCHYKTIHGEVLGPCGKPATGYRWYQDVEHQDDNGPACDEHRNEGGTIIAALLAAAEERDRLAKRVAVIEAEALERAAKVCSETLTVLVGHANHNYSPEDVAEHIGKEIRSLIPPVTP